MSTDRCSGVDDRNNLCRRSPLHVRDGSPHRWWASHGNMPASTWPVTAEELRAARAQQSATLKPGDVLPLPLKGKPVNDITAADLVRPAKPKPQADVRVKNCLDCPLFDAVVDRCQHPSMGKFGHDVSVEERGTVPIFCALRLSSLTIEAAA